MALSIKTTHVLVSLIGLLLIIHLFSGRVERFNEANNNPIHSLQEKFLKEGKRMKFSWRKLAMLEAVLDYDDAEPNPRHDPRRKRSNP
ncbi:hypothetical protein PanWU01x14_068750 [Parasponia andersonii]|uniref:Transmembrane protein n=1 Tax=Parasponia andersonii TaxID=3476 RepID=A0A2P5DFI5_PARAD|nr:hypothetical protein PanWU01x14_068750 [Parasponia andersonii]